MNKLRRFNNKEFKENANKWINNFYQSYVIQEEQDTSSSPPNKENTTIYDRFNYRRYDKYKNNNAENISPLIFEKNVPSLVCKQLKLISDPQKQFSLLLNSSNINNKQYVNPNIVMAFYNSKFNNNLTSSSNIMTVINKSLFTNYICFLLRNNQIEYSVDILKNYINLKNLNLLDLEILFNCIIIDDDLIFLKFWFQFLIQNSENLVACTNAATSNNYNSPINNNHLILIMLNHPNEKFKSFLKLFQINDLKSFNYVLNVYNNLNTFINFENGKLSILSIMNFINNYDHNNNYAISHDNNYNSNNNFLEIHNIQLNVSNLFKIHPLIVLTIFEIFINLKFEDSLILILNKLTQLVHLRNKIFHFSKNKEISNLSSPLPTIRSFSKFLIRSRQISEDDLQFKKYLKIFSRLKSWNKLAVVNSSSSFSSSIDRISLCFANSLNTIDLNYLIQITNITDDSIFHILNYCLKYDLQNSNYRFLMGRLLSKIIGRDEFTKVSINFQKLINKYIEQIGKKIYDNTNDFYNSEIINKITLFYYYVFNHGSLNKYLSNYVGFNNLILEKLFDKILLFDYTKSLSIDNSIVAKKNPVLLNFFKQLKIKDEKYLIKLIKHFKKNNDKIHNEDLKRYQLVEILHLYPELKNQSIPHRLLNSILSMENLRVNDDSIYELIITIINCSKNIDYYLNKLAEIILKNDDANKKINLLKILNSLKKTDEDYTKYSKFEELLILSKVKYGRINESQLQLLLNLNNRKFSKLDIIAAYLYFLSSVDLQLSKNIYWKYLPLLMNSKRNEDSNYESIIKNKLKQSLMEGVLSNEKLTNDMISKLTIFMKSIICLRSKKQIKQLLTDEEFEIYSMKKFYLNDENFHKLIKKINNFQISNEIIYNNPEISPRLILRFIRRYLQFVKHNNKGSIQLIRWLLFTYFRSSLNNYKLRKVYPHSIEYQMAMSWYYFNSKTIYKTLANMRSKKQGFWSFKNLILKKKSTELLRKFHYGEED